MPIVLRRPLLVSTVLLPLLAACSGLKTVEQPDMTNSVLLQNFSAAPQVAQQQQSWWLAFDDPQLTSLIEQALANNYTLKASLARLRQSEALVRVATAGQTPALNLEAGKSRNWREDSTTDQWRAGLSASYEVDFWGAVAAAGDQAQFELQASRSTARIQANTVASQVANSWFGYLHESHNLTLLELQKQRIESGLAVIEGRYRRGQSAVSDVWQQQTLLESIRADLVSAGTRRDIYRQQLQLWLGGQDFNAELTPLPTLSEESPLAVSLQALFERPDVQQAYFNLQAANAGVAVADANRYPRFTLSASYTGQDARFDQMFDNWVANLAANLVLPLLDGGSRRAQLSSQQALLQSRMAEYQQTYLSAAQEVQQLLLRQQEQQQLDRSLVTQLALAKKTEAFQSNRYRRGVGDYFALLSAQRDVLSLERQLISNQLAFNQSRISLYQAVSHGRFLPQDTAFSEATDQAQETQEPRSL